MVTALLALVLIFLAGLACGSFLNVLIDRLPMSESPWRGRSHCDHCKKTLAAVDLIPILSFLALRGKCRYCHKKLSWEYPLVETITGLVFVSSYIYLKYNYLGLFTISAAGFLQVFISLLVVFCSFLVIVWADSKCQLIPDEMVISAGLGALAFGYFSKGSLVTNLLAGLVASAFLVIVYVPHYGFDMR
jgi:leader peptidase (prepilin peptidase)/N-methyltransferase